MRALFHAHSTLFGVIASAFVTAIAGAIAQWSAPAMLIAAFVSLIVLPRVFYGRAAAKALDAEHARAGSRYASRYDGAGIGRHAQELLEAYDEVRGDGLQQNGLPRDPRALERFAEDEERS